MVIVASDRMITHRNVREYELADQTKTFELTPKIMVLIAGHTEAMLEICRATWLRQSKAPTTRVADAVEVFAEEFRKYRLTRNERRVLAPYGLTMAEYLQKQRDLAPDVRDEIEGALRGYDSDVGADAIIAGVDDRGAHVYIVSDPGEVYPQNAAGYAAIGIGAEHAESVFMAAQYTPKRFWAEALILTYQAKKRAQVAPGVGNVTDFYWITDDRTTYFDPRSPLQTSLEGVYADRTTKERAALTEDTLALLDWMEKINATPNTASTITPLPSGAIEGSDQEGFSDSAQEGESEG